MVRELVYKLPAFDVDHLGKDNLVTAELDKTSFRRRASSVITETKICPIQNLLLSN